jgi:gamma-glutamylcyclotransferase (GGCT)/AIG2-like uncharacterized protein YtfP
MEREQMSATRHIFCYGSLMFAEVWSRVVQGHYATQPGWVRGYQRRGVTGELFPCLIPGTDQDCVHGVIYMHVRLDDIARLDAFEGHLYDRHTTVCTGRDQHTYAVDLYVIKPHYRALVTDTAWDAVWFATQGLPQFLSRDV